jgi:hypothetical protein
VLVLLALAAVILWVVSRKNHFDPAHQDVSLEALEQVSGAIVLYQRPLKPWQLPGTTDGWQDIDLGIFPDSVASEQWQPKTRVKTFDPENLYVKINGEAERFLRHGFTQLSYLVLNSSHVAGRMV